MLNLVLVARSFGSSPLSCISFIGYASGHIDFRVSRDEYTSPGGERWIVSLVVGIFHLYFIRWVKHLGTSENHWPQHHLGLKSCPSWKNQQLSKTSMLKKHPHFTKWVGIIHDSSTPIIKIDSSSIWFGRFQRHNEHASMKEVHRDLGYQISRQTHVNQFQSYTQCSFHIWANLKLLPPTWNLRFFAVSLGSKLPISTSIRP